MGPPPITHASHNNTRDNLTDKGGCKRAIFAPLVISKDTLIFSFSNTWQRYLSAVMAAWLHGNLPDVEPASRAKKQQKAGAETLAQFVGFQRRQPSFRGRTERDEEVGHFLGAVSRGAK